MITNFPLDYMHLICLGVTKRLLVTWTSGPLNQRLSKRNIEIVSQRLLELQVQVPEEFARRPRSLKDLPHWKATEFRMFLLYTGPIVLKDILPHDLYQNFILLSSAVSILVDKTLCTSYIDYAKDLLKLFVKRYGVLYAPSAVVYNIHGLIHIADDARNFGTLDEFSCFPFESYLGHLKKMVRSTCSDYPPNF
jgi:hypothetical protein